MDDDKFIRPLVVGMATAGVKLDCGIDKLYNLIKARGSLTVSWMAIAARSRWIRSSGSSRSAWPPLMVISSAASIRFAK